MDRSLAADLQDALASARDLVREWLDEGVETFERSAPSLQPHRPRIALEPARGTSSAAAPKPTPAASPQQTALGDVHAPSSFGERPTLASVRTTLGDCKRCRLADGRTQIVFGDGNPDADLLFIGEGPGEQEDREGIPFVGRAGELLTTMIERGLGIARSSVYICNIVKCRPPQNRTPLADEVHACRAFLDGQIDAVRPKVIVALGKPATSLLLGRDISITRVRGTWQEYRGTPLMPTFHPAFVLRQYTQENRRLVWEDLKGALGRARELGGRFEA